jgi:hypothetical protein
MVTSPNFTDLAHTHRSAARTLQLSLSKLICSLTAVFFSASPGPPTPQRRSRPWHRPDMQLPVYE